MKVMQTWVLLLGVASAGSAPGQSADTPRWQAEAAHVTITRDDWGIAHIHGHTDADAVFGMIYAQCEDDFHRVERNYLTSLGRTAEADGESAIWQDLRQRLFIDPEDLKKDYAASPDWLKKLMDAWADGINFYLAMHPEVNPQVLTHFEPWMALSFTEGSIGGDIERVDLKKLQAFYESRSTGSNTVRLSPGLAPQTSSSGAEFQGQAAFRGWGQSPGKAAFQGQRPDPYQPGAQPQVTAPSRTKGCRPDLCGAGNPLALTPEPEPSGSNGIAIAPSNTRDHHALLLINPHTSFFFRSELQMSSDEGLDAYGAVTWGQFFIYQGFNEHAGWMHTSSGVDAVDEYAETENGSKQVACNVCGYLYGGTLHQFGTKLIVLRYSTASGVKERTFNGIYTLHGPVVRREGNNPVSIQLMNIPIPALEQSYLRTKAHNYAEYKKTMELKANSSNNTLFADADGDIAYWHGNFIPKRDPRFDFTKPVDGSDPATDWHGLMTLDEIPHLLNPKSGYFFNVNDSPWNGAGASSLKQSDFPAYVEQGIESARGVHAMRVLAPDGKPRTDFTLESLRAAAYDSYLPWFGRTIPQLVAAWDALPDHDSALKAKLGTQIALLRAWDDRWSADSIPTSLAVYWGTELLKTVGAPARAAKIPSEEWVATKLSSDQLLQALATASDKLTGDFGKWQIPWGEINRFQRLNDDIAPNFTDTGASIPVPFTSALWGSLASFGARQYPNTKKWYGTSGNSFVAVVEFGPKVHAVAVTAGGESGNPASPHFNDEALRYASGNLREVYFYPDQLKSHTDRIYHPGQ
jgi:acyl-homoserine-lactone acylase